YLCSSAAENQTLRFFGGRQPLWGIGVVSRMVRTSKPAVASARTADSRPEPGPLTRTSTVRSPTSFALLAAVSAACWAANGVPLREPRKPREPALDHDTVLPSGSEIVTIVLLNVACTCTTPTWTTFFSFFLKVFFFVPLAAAFAIMFSTSLSSYWLRCPYADLCGCAHWCGYVDPAWGARADGADRGKNPFRCADGC